MTKTTEEDLRTEFGQFGAITEVCLKNRNNGIVFAFVDYDGIASAEKAI
jgi:RNA recognition motif-containing protein